MAGRWPPLDELRHRAGGLAPWIPAVVVAAAVAFMFWTRYRAGAIFRRRGGGYLVGIDSYYHFRTAVYTANHWPNTMPFDIWTSFPDGRYVGQFGTAYDQLVATVALVAGLGHPSEAIVYQTVLVLVPVVAALIALPIYGIGKQLGGRVGGIVGVVALALFPGQFYTRTLAGQLQHHDAELLLMATALFAFVYAFRVARRDDARLGQLVARDGRILRPTLLAAALAGVALAAYQWVWPPGVVLVGILGVFFVAYPVLASVRGRSPEPIALAGAVATGVAGILVLGVIEELSTSPTSFGYLSPVLSFGVTGACLFVAGLSHYGERRALPRWAYAGTILAAVGLAVGLLWVALPDVAETLVDNLSGRILPFGHDEGTLTIQEAQPPDDVVGQAVQEFGFGLFTALVGLAGLVLAVCVGSPRAEQALVVVWALFLLSMSLAQIRFFYYLALAVAVLNAALVGQLLGRLDVSYASDRLGRIDAGQVLAVLVVLMVVVPLLPGVGVTASVTSGYASPHDATFRWDGSLSYLSGSTPAVGDYGGAGNELDYYGTYASPADGSFDYPDGAYGIMSWWTYGHLITVEGERIPHANPFQDGARSAAAYFLAGSEERANLILDAIAAGEPVDDRSTAELEALAAEGAQTDGDGMRYVMIDAPMVAGDFGTMAPWIGETRNTYITEERVFLDDSNQGDTTIPRLGERFHDTTLASLYLHDANGMAHYRLVHESTQTTTIGSIARETGAGEWEPLAIGVDFANLNVPPEQLRRADEYALYDVFSDVPAVKTFERVKGATITGQTDVDPGAQVNAELDLTTAAGRNLTYSQRTTVAEDGTFEFDVPYATTEELGPADGYTETAVQADGNYTITVLDGPYVAERGTVAVPEPAIYEGEEIAVTVESGRSPGGSTGDAGVSEDPDDAR